MTEASQARKLVLEIERVQTIRRRVATLRARCSDCGDHVDFVHVTELARVFDVSLAEAVLQLRSRNVHMQHLANGIVVCTASLLARSDTEIAILCKSLPPASPASPPDGS